MTREKAIIHMTLRRDELKHSVGDLDEDIKAFDMAIKALEQTRWILVSEKLPEFIINNTVSEDVLVFDGVDIRVGEYRKGTRLNGAEYWRVYGYEYEFVDVIAWMPLPEPYKQEVEE